MKCIEVIDSRFIERNTFINPDKIEKFVFLRDSENDSVMTAMMCIQGGKYFSYMRSGNMGLRGSSGGINSVLSALSWIRSKCPDIPLEFHFCDDLPIDFEIGDIFHPQLINTGDAYISDKRQFEKL